jgi:predicted RNA-binding protein with PUA-like domain
MRYWILKTEPETYSFQDLMGDKKTSWDGVRNYQARNNLRAMDVGDICVIYESGGPKAAVGLAKIIKKAYKDPKSEEDWVAVDLAPLEPFARTVTLAEMKADKVLKNMVLVKNARLSVCPLTEAEFKQISNLARAPLG